MVTIVCNNLPPKSKKIKNRKLFSMSLHCLHFPYILEIGVWIGFVVLRFLERLGFVVLRFLERFSGEKHI